MARAHYIYIVVNMANDAMLTAFTVKHECVTWLHTQQREGFEIDGWVVFSFPDGKEPQYPVHHVNAASFCGA